MTPHRDDDTDSIDVGHCPNHGVSQYRIKANERGIADLWTAVNEMRKIFWGVLLTTTGTLAITVLNFVLNKAG